MNDLILLKVGGSLITEKDKKIPAINQENLKRIAKEVSEAYRTEKFSLIFVHGVGSFGHVIVNKTRIDKGINKQSQLIDFAETQRLQNELNVEVCKEFINQNIPTIPVQASASAIMNAKEFESMHIDTIEGMLKIGLVPTLFGVPAYDKKQGCSILSGDDISVFLVKKFKIKKLIHATDVDGIFDSDPKDNFNAKIIKRVDRRNFEEVLKYAGGSKNTDVTGGMRNKIKNLIDLKETTSEIINGNKPNYIKRALLGESGLGTVIRA